jgi:2TM domain
MVEQNEQNLLRTRRNGARKLGFFILATAFALVNLSLFAVNLWSTPSRFWAVFPFFGWGLGLLIHGVVVFAPFDRLYQWLLERELARDAKSPNRRRDR